VLFDLANEVNKDKSTDAAGLLKGLGEVLGLLASDADIFLQGGFSSTILENSNLKSDLLTLSKEDIDVQINARLEAKKAKNYAEADRIRKELANAGILLEDTPQGTTWRKA
jgi:cysteinyl-tRNA synthetase